MENMQTPTWLLVAYIIVRDAIIPLSLKLLPARQEQAAKKEEKEIELHDREITALEGINQSLSIQNVRMLTLENGQSEIAKTLSENSRALSVLVDRVARLPIEKPKGRKAL